MLTPNTSSNTSSNTKALGYTTMLISATLMGCVGLFARNIDTSGDMIAFTRFLVGALGTLAIVLASGKLINLRGTRLSPAIIFGGISLGLCLAAYVSSTKYTSLANAVFLIYTGPLFSSILAAVFLKEKVDKITGCLLSLVFIGTLMILGLVNYTPETGLSVSLSFKAENMVGDMLGLIAGFGYGLYLFLSRYRTDVTSEIRSFYNFLFGGLGIGAYLIFNPPSLAMMDGSSWVWLIAMAFFTGFAALGLLAVAARHLKAAELACVAYFECAVGAGIGIMVFGETMTAFQAFGGAMIIIGGVGQVVASTVVQMWKKSRPSAPLSETAV